jgi:hypothetical protein
LASAPVPFQGNLNRIQQILIAERLSKKLDGSRFHGSHGHRDVTVRSEKDDWNVHASLGQLLLEVEATDPGKPDVENQATGKIRTLGQQEFLRRPEQANSQPYRLDQALDRPANRWIAIYYENNRRWSLHDSLPTARGRMNWKIAPAEPGSAHQQPPPDSTFKRLIGCLQIPLAAVIRRRSSAEQEAVTAMNADGAAGR